ncbi:MAG: hypothetical protein Q4C47_02675 [Planctomycetia bacterium]|nr:hypothetical protein [Planctomycetia bacterium]
MTEPFRLRGNTATDESPERQSGFHVDAHNRGRRSYPEKVMVAEALQRTSTTGGGMAIGGDVA